MRKHRASIFKAFTVFKVFTGIVFVFLLVGISDAGRKPFVDKSFPGRSFFGHMAKGGMPVCMEKLSDSEERLNVCNTDLDQTRADLNSCNTGYDQIWTDLETCYADLGQAWTDIKTCNTDLNQIRNVLGTRKTDLDQARVDLETCNAALSECESNQAVCPEGASVAKTGQTKTYAPGDDGDIQAGVALTAPRFIDNGDGTVTDHLTGLIWMRNAGTFRVGNWADALQTCSSLADGSNGISDGSFAGDWRLPSIRELNSLVDFGHYNYALPEGHLFMNVMSVYWSSTTSAGNANYAVSLNQITGFMNYTIKNGGNVYVLCVRN